MAHCIQINFLENATPDEWDPILNELQENQELVTFYFTLVLDNNEILPIFPSHEGARIERTRNINSRGFIYN